MTAEGVFPKSDGDIFYSSEANFIARPIQEVYTGSGFDSSATATTDEQSYELTAVSSTNASSAKYVKVKITGTAISDGGDSSGAIQTVRLKAQIKETGGSYGDIETYKYFLYCSEPTTGDVRTTATYELIYELTTGMKTNGFQIKVFSESYTNDSSEAASFTNIQTVVELA